MTTQTYSKKRRSKMSSQVVLEPRGGQQLTLESIVRNQLRTGHQDGSVHVGSQTTHQLSRSFLLDNPEESIKGMLVVSLLFLGQLAVVDHPDVDYICWVSESATDTSC